MGGARRSMHPFWMIGFKLARARAGRAVGVLRLAAMSANRMNRDEFYAAMAPHDDACLRKVSGRRP
jgi:hypothetical protein